MPDRAAAVEAAARVAHRRSLDDALIARPDDRSLVEGVADPWLEIADDQTRDYFRELVREPVEAALDA